MSAVELVAGQLLIRSWAPEDAEAVHRACQDPDIQRWTGIPGPYERGHADWFVGQYAESAWSTGTAAPLGVFDLATGTLLGAHGLASINQVRRSGEVGFWTAPWARGTGVAVLATRAVATWAFAQLGLDRLTWAAEVGNHASRLVALRSGFHVGGEQRLAQPHPNGRREGWIGSLLPGEITTRTPERYATGSRLARRAAVFGHPVPELPFDGVPGRLRALREGDVDAATRAAQDPESARWTTIPVPYARIDAEYYVHDHVPLMWARGVGAGFAITDRDDRYVGGVDLRLDPWDEEAAEVGFMVAPWARRHGYATAAVRTICDWGFAALGLARIGWRAYLGNDGSRRVAEKAGFTVEGVGRAVCVQRGRRRDAWLGSRLSSD